MSTSPMPFVPAVPTAPAAAPVVQSIPAVMPVPAAPEKPAKKAIPATDNKVIGAKVTVQFKGPDGNTYESTTVISPDEYKVQKYALDIEEKHEKKRDPETKDLLGFEDTGERILTFKLRYHVR